jgi:hypothetical protein
MLRRRCKELQHVRRRRRNCRPRAAASAAAAAAAAAVAATGSLPWSRPYPRVLALGALWIRLVRHTHVLSLGHGLADLPRRGWSVSDSSHLPLAWADGSLPTRLVGLPRWTSSLLSDLWSCHRPKSELIHQHGEPPVCFASPGATSSPGRGPGWPSRIPGPFLLGPLQAINMWHFVGTLTAAAVTPSLSYGQLEFGSEQWLS